MSKRKTATKKQHGELATRSKQAQSTKTASDVGSVDAYMQALDHPLKDAIEDVRQVILGVDPAIQEGIKWNSPSFRTNGWFATLNVRGKNGSDRVWLILHAGARASPNLQGEFSSADPESMLKWLGKDRAVVTFATAKNVKDSRTALEKIIRRWIKHV